MPGTVRTIDATWKRYDSDEDRYLVTKPRGDSNLESQIQMPASPAESDIATLAASPAESPSATTREQQRITRHIDRGTPGDQVILSEGRTPERKELAKRKSQYYGDAFAYREPNTSARERVTKESMIVADVRTNVIVHDEYTVITDLSYYLSQRYQRPENSIVVTISHSLCMLFGGNFDPAYTLTITALPSQLQPVTNKRNAALLATHMEESFHVDPRRGVIKFVTIAEENLANGSMTVSGEIEELAKETSENHSTLPRSLSRSAPQGRRRQSMKSLRGRKSSPMPTHKEHAPPTPTLYQHDAYLAEKSELDRQADKVQKMSRRKSFIATIFGKAG